MRDLLDEWAPSGTPGSLRLAVRNGYLNFYHLGQSVPKVKFPREGTATASIHHKYVRRPNKPTYPKIHASQGLDDTGTTPEWGGPKMLNSWIAKAACHANREKRLVDALLDRSSKIIDLEIALPARDDTETSGDGRRSAPRIDIAALDDDPARVVFWEVKRINDARLRSKSVPKVVDQLHAYREYVRSKPQLFKDAYRNTCCILSQFHDIACGHWDSPRPLDRLVSEVANGLHLEVDDEPRLLIIEDEAHKGNWDHHLSELTNRLGDRVQLVRPGQPLPRVPRRPA